MKKKKITEQNSPSCAAEEVGICVICAGTTLWEQEKIRISEASFPIKRSILWIHPRLMHPIQPAGATAEQVWGVVFFSPSLYVSATVATSFLKSVFVFFFSLCSYQLSCLVSYFFSPSFSFSSVFLAYCVLASFQLCSSICPHSILQRFLCN